MSGASGLFKARWVFPVDRLPIQDGVVEILDGRVACLESAPDAEAIDLGDVAIIPGLVNAHTHLEFSQLTQPLEPSVPFDAWIRALVRSRRDQQLSSAEIIRQGLAETVRSGTTLLGEIATSAASGECAADTAPQMVAFWEVLGLDEDVIDRQQAAVEQHLNVTHADTAHLVRGLSPHAPYSIHPDLFRWTIDRAQQSGVPVAMHLAETKEELELIQSGTGPLVQLLRDFGVWQDGLFPGGQSVRDYLETLAPLDRVLIVHGNFLNTEDMAFLEGKPQFSVVYCPRTHAYFRHQGHPWLTLLERNICVALGTDSRASNPDLNLWEDVLYLHASAPNVSGETLLQMATLNGARALGLDEVTGSLTPGKLADLAVVEFGGPPGDQGGTTAHHHLLQPQSRVVATMRAGHWIGGPPPH